MKCVCPKHGSSLHYHVCRHVREACDSGEPLPDLDLTAGDLICRACMTEEVRELVSRMSNIEANEESIKRFWDAFHALQSEIGYGQLCTDCLYEKTGLDLRRRPLSTHT